MRERENERERERERARARERERESAREREREKKNYVVHALRYGTCVNLYIIRPCIVFVCVW